uniref:Uncharacterized protein n=1 Tax=Lotus japonicus TaxID=34305 RepID=I3T7R7_LOTJA|nr:unknown [Lotus japonicus]
MILGNLYKRSLSFCLRSSVLLFILIMSSVTNLSMPKHTISSNMEKQCYLISHALSSPIVVNVNILGRLLDSELGCIGH